MSKKILFVSGTRADFGKLKPLIQEVGRTPDFDYQIFATGMHLLSRYGNTINEIFKSGFEPVFTYMNQIEGEDMEVVLANTIIGLNRYLQENPVDLIVVHGDRAEALAGATVGALKNILVAHVEGGEVSGTVDELMRHAISKLSHLHFVASGTAQRRLIQLGEDPKSVFVIGSPDVDVMLSQELPTLGEVRARYDINFLDYGLALLHPVTTELKKQEEHANKFVEALIASGKSYVVIFPNNDHGSGEIFSALTRLENNKRFKLFPSLRFEYFLVLLQNASFIIGNSSAGIHEAPVYGVPTVNIGNRQSKRLLSESIFNVKFDVNDILTTLVTASNSGPFPPLWHYGEGKSAERFIEALAGRIWDVPNQKQFQDLEFPHD